MMHKSIAFACFIHIISAQRIDCIGDDTCSDSIIQCSNENNATCTIDCVGQFACAGSVIYGGSGDMVLNCDGNEACARSVIHCPDERICNVSATNGAFLSFVFGFSSSELLVTVSADTRLSSSSIHCPLPATFDEPNWIDIRYPCHVWIDGENGTDSLHANDHYAIYGHGGALGCLNPPCDGYPATIYMDRTHTYKSIEAHEPDDDGSIFWDSTYYGLDVAEGDRCTQTEGYDLESICIDRVSEDGKYFHFDDDYDGILYDVLYEATNEWIPVLVSNGTGHKYPLSTAAAGDWELGSFKRLRSDITRDSCGDGLQCDDTV